MPLYEYRCKPCERNFEVLRSFSQKDEPTACPACGVPTKLRLLSLIATPVSSDGASEAACPTSAAMGMPCCGGGCGLPMRRS